MFVVVDFPITFLFWNTKTQEVHSKYLWTCITSTHLSKLAHFFKLVELKFFGSCGSVVHRSLSLTITSPASLHFHRSQPQPSNYHVYKQTTYSICGLKSCAANPQPNPAITLLFTTMVTLIHIHNRTSCKITH